MTYGGDERRGNCLDTICECWVERKEFLLFWGIALHFLGSRKNWVVFREARCGGISRSLLLIDGLGGHGRYCLDIYVYSGPYCEIRCRFGGRLRRYGNLWGDGGCGPWRERETDVEGKEAQRCCVPLVVLLRYIPEAGTAF